MNKSRIEQGLADYLGAKLAAGEPSQIFTADANLDQLSIVGHGYANQDQLRLLTASDLPAPLVEGRPYHVINATTDTFQLALFQDGAAIDLTDAGTGPHTAHKVVVATRPGTSDQLLPTSGHTAILTLEHATLEAGHLGTGMLRVQLQTAGALQQGALAGFQEAMDRVEAAFPKQHKAGYAGANALMSAAVTLATGGEMTINGNFAYGWEDAEDEARFIQDYVIKVGLAESP